MSKYWDVENIEQEHGAAFSVKTKDGYFEAFVRFDGCMHIWGEKPDSHTEHFQERDRLHFDGGLKKFIKQLEELRDLALSRLDSFSEQED